MPVRLGGAGRAAHPAPQKPQLTHCGRRCCWIWWSAGEQPPIAAAVRPRSPPAMTAARRRYENTLTPIEPRPLLAQWPQFVQPVRSEARFEAPMLVDDGEQADLGVRAWRWSYNARGIIELPNRLTAADTAVIVVHPWGIDDGQGWRTPQPAGVCDMCTEEKNLLAGEHTTQVVNPLVARLREAGCTVVYSLRGNTHPITDRLYRTIHKGRPSAAERAVAAEELTAALNAFEYDGHASIPSELQLSESTTVNDYFSQFPGLDAEAGYNGEGFW
jgi:hypothetical protein